MSYAVRYSIELRDPDENPLRIDIEQDSFTGSKSYLKGTQAAFRIKNVDNNEDKYSPIIGRELTLNFISENGFNLQDIITQDDIEFRVILYYVGTTDRMLFSGFLVTDSCYEQLRDDPKEIQLRAVDGLGLLKNDAIYDLTVYTYKSLLEIIQKCLTATNQELDLVVEVNVYELAMSDRNDDPTSEPFSQTFIHTWSFLSSEGYAKCYDVLQALMEGFLCTICQQNGRWFIQRRHDKYASGNTFGTLYSFPYISATPAPVSFDHTVSTTPVNFSHIKGFLGKVASARVEYDYEIADTPRNKSLTDGDFLSPVSGPTNTAYTINYWDPVQNPGDSAASATCYRNEVYDVDSRIKESYIVIPREVAGVDNGTNLRSQAVPVQAGDRIHISFETRSKFDFTVSTTPNIRVLRVYLTDGITTYHLRNDRNWYTGTPQAVQVGALGSDSDVWFPCDIESADFPIDGDLRVYFCGWDSGASGNESWFRNISIDFEIFLTTSTRLHGEFASVSQGGTLKRTLSNTVTIGDAPKKIIKGALFLDSSGTTLTSKWNRLDSSDAKKLIIINALSLFQSAHRIMLKIDGDFFGMQYEDPEDSTLKVIIGPINTFTFPNTGLLDKKFIPTNQDIDLFSAVATMSLQEVYDNTDSVDDTGTIVNQYLYE